MLAIRGPGYTKYIVSMALIGNTAQISRQRSLKSDILKKNRSKSVRKRRLMPFKIMQLPNQDKLCQTFSLPVLERLYDRQTIEELISAFHHKPTRARKLTMTIVIYVLIPTCHQ